MTNLRAALWIWHSYFYGVGPNILSWYCWKGN